MSKNKNKLNFKYIFGDNYNPLYINGASGGLSPNNEIIINFYLERPALPNKLSFNLDKDFQVIGENEEEREPEDLQSSFVRFVQNGVIFDYNTAKSLQDFLNKTISDYEERNSIADETSEKR